MIQYVEKLFLLLTIVTFLCQLGCKGEPKEVNSKALPDLNTQLRPYVTIENTKLRTGPEGPMSGTPSVRKPSTS